MWTSATAWLAHLREVHPLFRLPGVSILNVMPDLLHCKHLGSDSWFYGSVMTLLTHHIMEGDPDTNLERIWEEIKAVYQERKITDQYTGMTVGMYHKTNSFPRLKGRAAEIRHFVEPLMVVFRKYMSRESQPHRQILMALEASAEMERILDDHVGDYVLPDEAHQQYWKATFEFLALATAVSTYYHGNVGCLFNFTIKFHLLAHIAFYAKYFNPRLAWCYSGEDFMQKIKKIVGSCQRGTSPCLVATKAVGKYASGLAFVAMESDVWLDSLL